MTLGGNRSTSAGRPSCPGRCPSSNVISAVVIGTGLLLCTATLVIVTLELLRPNLSIDDHINNVLDDLEELAAKVTAEFEKAELTDFVITTSLNDISKTAASSPQDTAAAIVMAMEGPSNGLGIIGNLTRLVRLLEGDGGIIETIQGPRFEYETLGITSNGLANILQPGKSPKPRPYITQSIMSTPISGVPASCQRHGVLAVGGWGFATMITHTLGSCYPTGSSTRSITTYRVRKGDNPSPVVDETGQVRLEGPTQRISCSLTALELPNSVVVICSVSTTSGGTDVRQEWIRDSRITSTASFSAPTEIDGIRIRDFTISLGVGLIRNEKIITSFWATVDQTPPSWYPVHCPKDTCPNATQDACNSATGSYQGRFLLGGILVTDRHTGSFSVVLLHPSKFGEGGEGAFLDHGDEVFFYQRSVHWYPGVEIWRVADPTNPVTWTQIIIPRLRRTGTGSCSGSSGCPQKCLTGTSQVPDMISIPGGDFFLTVAMTRNPSSYLDPIFYYGSINQTEYDQYEFTSTGGMFSSATRLLHWGGEVYSVMIVDKGPGLMGAWDSYPAILKWSKIGAQAKMSTRARVINSWLYDHVMDSGMDLAGICPNSTVVVSAVCSGR